MAKVTVAIVSFNTRELLRRCLLSLPPLHQTIVVDNASGDGSAAMVREEFPDVDLVANDANRGFGAANNQALDRATGDLVLLLNGDAALASADAVDRLVEALDDSTVVAAGGALLNADGTVQPSAARGLSLWAVFCEQTWLERLLPGSRLFSPYWVRSETKVEVEQAMGACLLMRPVERFDERYFLYCEDTDLCRRLRAHGRILYVPEARFFHELGASSGRDRWRAVARYNRGKELYFSIHQGVSAMVAAWTLNRMGALLRLAVWTVAAALTLGRYAPHAVLWVRVLLSPLRGPG